MKIKVGTDEKIFYIVNYVLLAIFAVMFLYPIVYVFSAAVSNPYFVETGSVVLIPKGFNFNSFKSAMQLSGIWRAYGNSIFITVFGTIVSISCRQAWPSTSSQRMEALLSGRRKMQMEQGSCFTDSWTEETQRMCA